MKIPSALCLLNFVVLQWAFVRLARLVDDETGKQRGWIWIVGVVPLTGWWSPYLRLGQ